MNTPNSPNDTRMPITLLTGFLGAGKTTVLNGILASGQGPKIAVIVNEFGVAGLDHDLIEAVDEDVILMESGCLCCSMRDDLVRALHDLMDRRSAGKIAFDRVVIETTGLADPGPVLQTLLVNPALARRVRMDGTVTVADAAAGPDTLDRQFESVSQVAMADLILLTKTDLVLEPEWRAFEERLRGLNPTAEILRTDHGRVDPAVLWNLNGMRLGIKQEQATDWLSFPVAADPLQNLSGFAFNAEPKEIHSPHDARIGSVSVVLDDPITVKAFDLWLDTLIALRGPDILRVKGIVHLEGVDTPFVFHGVQHLFDPPVPIRNWEGDVRQSRIVVIARDMTRPELTRSLDMLRAQQTEPTLGLISERALS